MNLKDLAAKDPRSLNGHISAAMTFAEDCKDGFEESHMKLDPHILMKINSFQDVCSILLKISTMLPNF
ncbi:hypothetical protein N665_0009s0074 [Sinapis alba]|nr:hypothetical protein N665_0009s0074 [Sinapis alba]